MSANINHTRINQGFQFLRQAMSSFLNRELRSAFGTEWWNIGVLGRLFDEQKRNLPREGSDDLLTGSLDIYLCLLLLDLHWNEIFRRRLAADCRTWARELTGVRNRWAHAGSDEFDDDDTWRALDTMSRLCEQIDPKATEDIRALLREARYGSAAGSMSATTQAAPRPAGTSGRSGILTESPDHLPAWRKVIEPHPDVAQGRYRNAEFAADLAQVARGEGSYEYLDPVEFFARTYITEGMSRLLVQALKRVSGQGGEPVIQLKTAFGGGKTHSMLALYHLLRGTVPLEKMPAVRPVLQEAGLSVPPKVHAAVLVGTALDPSRGKRPPNLPGVTIHTLWGEIAAQLALSAQNPKLYDLIKEADKKGISPGSEALKKLFDACGSCLVLMDELVAYARRIYGVDKLLAGSFDNFITFIQEITEAARASKSSLVVASIPESNIEIGGEAGQRALAAIEHTFGRMESIWTPVNANEGFEVVRRRLFLNCRSEAAREMVCAHFSRMYYDNPTDFPLESRELAYKKRLLSCYPIHPELFDRLYEDWATLEHFQRTRGVLRLMAAVIHELWMNNDAGLLIMPGSLPLDTPDVRNELTRYLPDGWSSVLDKEVDGDVSIPFKQDSTVERYYKSLASRRVARSVMLGSAPTVRQQKVRGIEASRIRLGVVQPGEQIPVFNDALNSLRNSLAYLYSNPSGDRFWYDTRPTLRKTVEERATQFAEAEVDAEIERRLKTLRRDPPFAGVHICPASSLDVPDEQAVRLVVLGPAGGYAPNVPECPARQGVQDTLDTRGTAPRMFKNMLVFLAPDQAAMPVLKEEVRRFLAWKSVQNDSQVLNLDAAQNKETDNSLKRSNEAVDSRLSETWCWLLLPYSDRSDRNTLEWEHNRLSGGKEIIKRAAATLVQNEAVIEKWAPALLLSELDRLLWQNQDELSIRKLWKDLCTYCYLPRLAGYDVLEKTIAAALPSEEYFGYAAAPGEGRYIGLVFGRSTSIDKSGYLVKAAAARKQLEREQAEKAEHGKTAALEASAPARREETGRTEEVPAGTSKVTGGLSRTYERKSRRFYLASRLDNTRVNRDVQRILEEIVSVLSQEERVTMNITLDIQASAPEGFQPNTVRAVAENCHTLKIDNFGFEES